MVTIFIHLKIQKKAGLILENSALFVDLERKNFETRKIIEISQKILSSLDTKNILDFILDSMQEFGSRNGNSRSGESSRTNLQRIFSR